MRLGYLKSAGRLIIFPKSFNEAEAHAPRIHACR